jgi:hypothetical protein
LNYFSFQWIPLHVLFQQKSLISMFYICSWFKIFHCGPMIFRSSTSIGWFFSNKHYSIWITTICRCLIISHRFWIILQSITSTCKFYSIRHHSIGITKFADM